MKTFRYVIFGILVILMVTGVRDSIQRRSEREWIAPRETGAPSGREVAGGWKGFDLKRHRSKSSDFARTSPGFITAKLNETVPSLKLQDVTIDVAIEELGRLSKEGSPFGIDILIDERKIFAATPDSLTQEISLELSEFPLKRALDEVTGMLDLRYRLEPLGVVIVAMSDRDDPPGQFIRRYSVPSLFQAIGDDGNADLLAKGVERTSTRSAVEILKERGILFEENASAFYAPSTSELVVRNTAVQLDAVDYLVESLGDSHQ